MFQAGGFVVVLVEVSRKPYLASIVPVIVNAILNEHQIIVDIVAFVSKGDFPRSRLGEKQRGKILAGWVTRKIRTMAQFAIRDLDLAAMVEGSPGADGMDPNRLSMISSARNSGAPAGVSSLRNVEQAPQILEQEEFEHNVDHMANMAPARPMMHDEQTTPTGYNNPDLHPFDSAATPLANDPSRQPFQDSGYDANQGHAAGPPPGSGHGDRSNTMPQIRLPGVDGRENLDLWGPNGPPKQVDEEDWTADAIMHMNLAGDMGPPPGSAR